MRGFLLAILGEVVATVIGGKDTGGAEGIEQLAQQNCVAVEHSERH